MLLKLEMLGFGASNKTIRDGEMQEHSWIISVCEDLAEQATQQGLTKIAAAARRAAWITRSEIEQATETGVVPVLERLEFALGKNRLKMGALRAISVDQKTTAFKPLVVS